MPHIRIAGAPSCTQALVLSIHDDEEGGEDAEREDCRTGEVRFDIWPDAFTIVGAVLPITPRWQRQVRFKGK